MPLWPTVLPRMHAAAHCGGNPSSLHGLGRAARRWVDDAADALRLLLHTGPKDDVVFTGSAVEANALGLLGLARVRQAQGKGSVLLASPGCVPGAVPGFTVAPLREAALTDAVAAVGLTVADAALVSQARALGIPVHCDATAVDGAPVDFAALGVDTLAVCSVALGGPPGVAALVVAKGVSLAPLWGGGGQHNGWRSGTQAVAPIAGFGEAARCMRDRWMHEPCMRESA